MGNSTKEKAQKIPVGDSNEDIAARKKIFRQFDMNGNLYLSLAEIDKGLRDVLDMPEVFDTKPVIMRAFQAAKQKFEASSPHGDDYVSRGEFKYLLGYLKIYYMLWDDFEKIEVDGDRRISQAEFTKGYSVLVSQWGMKIDNPSEEFKKLLEKYGANANITWTQFCEYVIGPQLDKLTKLKSHDDI